MKPQSTETVSSSQSKFSIMHRESHAIFKPKPPNIRIIHIFAPEIIKADVQNFREIVQRLTGQPDDQDKTKSRKSSTNNKLPSRTHTINHQCPKADDQNKKRRLDDHGVQAQVVQGNLKKMKKEMEEIYGGNNGYLHGFGDMDCFNIQDLVVDFPLLPFKSSQMNIYSEISHYAN